MLFEIAFNIYCGILFAFFPSLRTYIYTQGKSNPLTQDTTFATFYLLTDFSCTL